MSVEHVTQECDSIVASLQRRWQNIDPFLLIKSSMLKRKYPARENRGSFLKSITFRGSIKMASRNRCTIL
ncbi:hypothetical protein NVIE_025020 [Nitrososphaera viennensis EN76]|uniref:Uncharacterized protein n=1 Tax=Nitrososphaera viennensis EN76 TaxID=926571 RepID=A0A060HNP4_9ARCH|nr:hypothetical protein NVIE_025020 [Nitrososphaera viennensis EN76]